MVGVFTLNNQGSFSIGSLSPGPHIVRVEPLDDADTDSFFSATARVELNFRVMFVDRVIVVLRGVDSGSVPIAVIGKLRGVARSPRSPARSPCAPRGFSPIRSS